MFSESCQYSTQDVGVLGQTGFVVVFRVVLETLIPTRGRWETGGQKRVWQKHVKGRTEAGDN